ncbi:MULTISPECIES: phosphate acetyltransferase [Eikenella]|uniref:Phosphate acetyltransferase n=1 Tax=Eikenella exigua TaxID=2528037 RepID=A0AAX1F8Y3_9NEIS|nr:MULTISPECIES: phosphate acetyltransferase [Eikenella]OAM43125.1 phosphate acetyltransferase [Eikenella sp. NML97-A-109]QED92515.1 phosphate acetyltransferase [Eikenella exigua]
MPNFLLVPIGTKTGLTSISLGLLRALQHSGCRPVYYKPVSHKPTPAGDTEAAIVFANKLFHLNPPHPQPLSKVEELVGAGRDDDLIELMVSDFDQVTAAEHDVAIIEGMVPDSERGFLTSKNAQIAAALNANVILVAAAGNHSAEQVADQINLAAQEYANSHTDVAGFIINRYHGNDSKAFAQTVAAKVRGDIPCMGVLPFAPEQSPCRVADIAGYLNAQVIAGQEHLGNRTKEIVVAAQNAAHMHHRITSGALVITPGDREDILMAASLKILSGVPVAGLLLTCGTAPSPAVQGIISPALSQNVPVLLTEHDTFATAYALAHQDQTIPADDTERMETMVEFVAEHIDAEELCRHIGRPRQLLMSPPAFRFRMMEQARAANRRIVLPEGDEPRTVEAAAICQSKGIARCVLLAKPEAVREVAANRGITLPEGLEIIDPDTIREQYVAPMVELRKNKGLTPGLARQALEDSVVLGTMMLQQDDVDGLVSGAVHTTANTIRPALQLIKTAPGASLVSSVFFMLMPEQVFVYGDCAVNPEPTAEELADIAIQSAESAKAFGIDPKVAMISYSTGTSGSGADVEKVKEATRLAQEKRPDLLIDGPLQYDAASVPSVGRQKAPDSKVAGQANVFVFPDLNTGNTTYKAVQRSANVLSIGPMLQGLRKPVNDLSRGALVDDIVYTIALTAIQAVQMGK